MSSDSERIREIVIRLMPSWQPDKISHVEYLSGGFSNENYAFRRTVTGTQKKYVLRVPEITQPFVDRREERNTYHAIAQNSGVTLIAFEESSGCLITQWLDGQLLAETPDNYNAQDLVNYVKSMHAALPTTQRQYHVPSVVQLLSPSNAIPIPEIAPDVALVPCHNDLNPWNVMVTPHGWKTLDWEFFGLNDPLFDLVTLHQGLALPDAQLWDLAADFLDAADEPRVLDNLRRFWIREFAWADYQVRAGNDREAIQQQYTVALEKLAGL